MTIEKVILVTRKTRLEGLIERYNTEVQARFLFEQGGGEFDLYQEEHDIYHRSLDQLQDSLADIINLHTIDREFLPNYIFTDSDLVVTIGIDGQVVNTAKYLSGQAIIAVNPDPANIDGVLLPFTVSEAPWAVKNFIDGKMGIKKISMAQVRFDDGQSLLAFNDFFIGAENHVSARYRISINGMTEDHSSSGIIVSTGVGSTGWFSSMFNMANGMLDYFAPQEDFDIPSPIISWDTDKLYFVVREPFISKTSSADIVCGPITRDAPLEIESHMASGGVIFSDGVASDFLVFNAGVIAKITLAEQQTHLVMNSD